MNPTNAPPVEDWTPIPQDGQQILDDYRIDPVQGARIVKAIRRNRLRIEAMATPVALLPFHRSKARKRILRGPNQGGKTWAGAKEALWLLGAMPHPHRDAYNERRAWTGKPVHGWVVCYSQKQSVTIQKTLYKLVPKHLLTTKDFNDSRGFLNGIMKLRNGSILEVKTVGQDTLGLASATLDFVWVDEPPPEEVYSELISRLMVRRGSLFITCTPIGRPVGWLKQLVDNRDIDDHVFALNVDNCPHLTGEQIQEQMKDVLPPERPQRIYGEWEGVTPDRLFDQFSDLDVSQGGNVIMDDNWYPSGVCNIMVSMDHGEGGGKQTAALIAHRRPRFRQDGRKIRPRGYILDDYVSPGATNVDEDARYIVDMLERNGIEIERVDRWVGDTNSMGKSMVGVSVNEALGEAIRAEVARRRGVDIEQVPEIEIETANKGPGSVDFGCRVINVAFGLGDLYVKACATASVKGFRHWQGGTSGEDGKLAHIVDGNRYGVIEVFGSDERYSRLRIRYNGGGRE